MRLRATAATAAAALLLTTALAPTAAAQDRSGLAEGIIANVDCDVLDFTLSTANLKDDTTTRSQLAANLREATGELGVTGPLAGLITAQYAGQIADRSLECGHVLPDPVLDLGSTTVEIPPFLLDLIPPHLLNQLG